MAETKRAFIFPSRLYHFHNIITRNNQYLLILSFLLGIVFSHQNVFAQKYTSLNGVELEINSGNPAFPFPQFLPYKKGKNLGTHAVPGLTHADMEKTIKEAWAIMMNRAIYSGESAGDAPGKKVKYIIFNPVGMPDPGTQPFCSEGDGYAMLGAALMADKTAFDGLFMAVHDYKFKKVKRYLDCVEQGLKYNPNPLPGVYDRKIDDIAVHPDRNEAVDGGTHDSAADGDWDIGMALVLASRQWGEKSGVYACGKEINYREEALVFMRALTDTLKAYMELGKPEARVSGYYSGDIGFDGYAKGGNTFGELTDWATTSGFGKPKFAGPFLQYFDYAGSGYFQVFANFLEEEKAKTGSSQYDWAISQFKRARASNNWLLQNVLDQGYLPYIGHVSMTNNKPTFGFFSEGEDFRLAWRNLADVLWHGQPEYIWDPVTHQIKPGTTDVLDQHAKNITKHFNKPSLRTGAGCVKLGQYPGEFSLYDGPMVIQLGVGMTGTNVGNDMATGTNWVQGTSSAAPVITEDLNLAGYMYQQCEIEWDASPDLTGPTGKVQTDDRYIHSRPKYFHEFFRLLGLMTLTGNYYQPNEMISKANVKTYVSIDRTYGFPKDIVKYVVKYRNYGSADATNAEVKFTVPEAFSFVSSTKGSASGNVVTWKITSIPGFKTGAEAATIDSIVVTVRVREDAQNGTFCATSTVSGSNFPTFTSNEFPNNATYTMERNCFDVVTRSLVITKTADKEAVNPGDIITYKVTFENSSKAGWLDGGRPGVKFTYAQNYQGTPDAVTKFDVFLRIMHGAHEPYINLKNYRLSYFVNETAIDKVVTDKTQIGWYFYTTPYYVGDDIDKLTLANQMMPYGQDAAGKKWNQRLIFKFKEDVISAPTNHLFLQTNNFHRIHKGTGYPFIAYMQIETKGSSLNYGDDWSFDVKNNATNEKDANVSLVLPDNSDPAVKDNMSMKVHPYGCGSITKSTDRVLVEEFDGYGWRRVLGTGPFAGREAAMVVVVDTLPKEVKWGGFNRKTAVGMDATYDAACHCVTWKKDALLVAEKGTLEYWVTSKNASEMGKVCPIEIDAKNRAWISAESESPLYSEVITHITCGQLPPPKPAKTTMSKLADKASYRIADDASYVIGYKQTQGTIADPDLKSKTDWVVTGTANFVNGAVTFANSKEYIQYDYSHGTNGKFTFEIEISNASNLFSLVFRNTANAGSTQNGVGIQVHPGPWGMQTGAVIAIMNGSTNVSQTDAFKPYDATDKLGKMKFDIYLHQDTMDVWLNKDPEADAPTLSATNLNVKAGYIGFYNSILGTFKKVNGNEVSGDGGNQIKITNWYSHFDSAFDVKIQDQLPDGLAYNDNSLKKIFTSSGFVPQTASPVYNAVTKSIEWVLSAGKKPMLADDSITFQFSGKVTGCPTKYITNIAYANMLGQAINKIGAQAVAECKTLAGCDPPASAIISTPDGKNICKTSIKLSASATPANADYFYTWIKDSKEHLPAAKNQAEIIITEPGVYQVVIGSDPADEGCNKKSDAVTITANPVNAGEILTDQLLCGGESAKPFTTKTAPSGGDGVNYTYQWYSSANKISWTKINGADKAEYANTLPLSGTTYFIREVNTPGCIADSTNPVSVTVAPVLPAPVGKADPTCQGETLKLYADLVPSATYEWKLVSGTIQNVQNPVLPNAQPATMSGDYTLRVKVGNCFSPPTKVAVTIKPKPLISDVEYHNPCAGQALQMAVITDRGDQFIWSGPAAFTGTEVVEKRDPFRAEMAGKYSVIAVAEGCKSDPFDFNVDLAEGPSKPTVSANPVCEGGQLLIKASEIPDAEYSWTGPGVFTGTGNVISINNATTALAGKYVVTANVDGCKSDTSAIIVKINPAIDPGKIGADQSICIGETPAKFTGTAAAGGNGNYTYQWQIRPEGVTDWADISNQKEENLQPGIVQTKTEYRRATQSGTCAVKYSNSVTIETKGAITPNLEIATADLSTTEICAADEVKFVVKSVGGANSTSIYQWKRNGEAIPNADSAKFIASNITSADKFSLVIRDLSTCATVDSVVSQEIQLTVKPNVTPVVEIESLPVGPVCEKTKVKFSIKNQRDQGQQPIYLWYNGTVPIKDSTLTYSSSTLKDKDKISLKLVSSEKCKSVDTVSSNVLTVSVGAKPVVGIKSLVKQFCQGDSLELTAEVSTGLNGVSFDWKKGTASLSAAQNGKPVIKVSEAGNYSLFVKTGGGCEAAFENYAITQLEIPQISVTPAASVICKGASPKLTASVNNSNLVYKWINQDDEPMTAQGSEFTPTESGEYRVILIAGTCRDTSEGALVTEKIVPKPDISGKDAVSCKENGVEYSVTPTAGSFFKWNLPAGAEIITSDKNAPLISVKFGTVAGSVSVQEVAEGGCLSEVASKPIEVNGCNLKPNFTFEPQVACAGVPVTFKNTSAGTSSETIYLWSFGQSAEPSGSESETEETVVFKNPGTYNVTLTAKEGAFSRDTLIAVKVAGPAKVDDVTGPASVCRNNTITFKATDVNSDYTYEWQIKNGIINSGQGKDAISADFSSVGKGSVMLIYGTRTGCGIKDSITKNIEVTDIPDLKISTASEVICQGSHVNIKATAGFTGYSWYRNDQKIPAVSNSSYNATMPGKYHVVTGTGTCISISDTIELKPDNLIIDAGPDVEIEAGNSVRLNVLSNQKIVKYQWFPGSVAPVADPTVKPMVTTTYIISAQGENGCSLHDTVVVTVVKPLFIPNAFTPNGDNVHDIWEIKGLEQYDNFEVEIFNRWGSIVHTAKSVTTANGGVWDGTLRGELMPVATYYYVIKLKRNGQTETETGSVLLSK